MYYTPDPNEGKRNNVILILLIIVAVFVLVISVPAQERTSIDISGKTIRAIYYGGEEVCANKISKETVTVSVNADSTSVDAIDRNGVYSFGISVFCNKNSRVVGSRMFVFYEDKKYLVFRNPYLFDHEDGKRVVCQYTIGELERKILSQSKVIHIGFADDKGAHFSSELVNKSIFFSFLNTPLFL